MGSARSQTSHQPTRDRNTTSENRKPKKAIDNKRNPSTFKTDDGLKNSFE